MIKEHLTEELLGQFLQTEFTGEIIRNKAYFNGSRCRPDFVLPDHKLIVEFDGHQHYIDHARAERDINFDHFIAENYSDWEIIHIPYFVQLDSYGIDFYFSKFLNLPIVDNTNQRGFNDFSHGFITTKFLPHMFCELGTSRFLIEMANFKCSADDKIYSDIMASLHNCPDFVIRQNHSRSCFAVYNKLLTIENDATNKISHFIKTPSACNDYPFLVYENEKTVLVFDSYQDYMCVETLNTNLVKIENYYKKGYKVINYPYFLEPTQMVQKYIPEVMIEATDLSPNIELNFIMETHLTPSNMTNLQKKYFNMTIRQWTNYYDKFIDKFMDAMRNYCENNNLNPFEVFDYYNDKDFDFLEYVYDSDHFDRIVNDSTFKSVDFIENLFKERHY